MKIKNMTTTNIPTVTIYKAEVESSFIASVEYIQSEECGQTLIVKMTNGRCYYYGGVPTEVVGDLLTAESIGKAYNATIKNIYPYVEG